MCRYDVHLWDGMDYDKIQLIYNGVRYNNRGQVCIYVFIILSFDSVTCVYALQMLTLLS